MDSHDEADDHQHGGQQERHTPTPGAHRIGVIERLQHEVGAVRQEEADRGAELREGAVQRTLVFGRVLGGDQRSTGPFAAKADALDETQQTQYRDRADTDLTVGRQAADEERADAHGHQRDDQRGLAAHAVTEVAEDQGSQRTSDERDGEGQQAHQQRDGGVVLRGEEDVREVVRCGGAVGVEVVEFDGGSDHRGGDHGLDRVTDHRLCFSTHRSGAVSCQCDCCHC